MTHEWAESTEHLGEFVVEAVGEDGEVYFALFAGPMARERAREYAEWKNGWISSDIG